jgi:hypothetical protein
VNRSPSPDRASSNDVTISARSSSPRSRKRAGVTAPRPNPREHFLNRKRAGSPGEELLVPPLGLFTPEPVQLFFGKIVETVDEGARELGAGNDVELQRFVRDLFDASAHMEISLHRGAHTVE